MSQGIYDLIFWCAAAIQERPFGFCKRLPARLALVPLATGFGLVKLDDVAFQVALKLAGVWTTPLILTKGSHLSQLGLRTLLAG